MGGRALAEGGAVAAVALAAGGVFLSCEGPGGGLALDDSWIHQQFARTLSQGGGFAFNAGQPVAGSTAPLWTLLLALLQLLPGDAVALTKGLGLALHGATALMAWQLARICGLGRDWALVAGLGTALMPRLLWGALSGMEIRRTPFVPRRRPGGICALGSGRRRWVRFCCSPWPP